MKKVFLLGSLNTDLVIESPRLPQIGETLHGGAFEINFGGKGANQAVAIAKLGGTVYMAGKVGDDTFGKEMLLELKNQGVNTNYIKVEKGVNSGVAVITVINGDNCIMLSGGANDCVSTVEVDELLSSAKQGDIFVTQGETPYSVTEYALKKAKNLGLTTVFNPAPAKKEFLSCLRFVDILTPNESEAYILTGETDLDKIADCLPCAVVVTLGGKGWFAKKDGKSLYGKPISVKVVDTTSAGDTFLGGLVYKLSLGVSLFDALPFASKCASIACTKKGAQKSIPTLAEVDSFGQN